MTSAPTPMTSPDNSPPITLGRARRKTALNSPSRVRSSAWLTPLATIRTSTSCGAGTGSGRERSRSGAPYFSRTKACMVRSSRQGPNPSQ